MNTPAADNRDVITLAAALSAEFAAIHGGDAKPMTECEYRAAALGADQTALCLSGGGIRSASFALGVLQSLARHRLLGEFHYLSTVSGGGYIGSWLSALVHDRRSVAKVVEELAADAPKPVDALRSFTSYLAPNPGLASADTWSGIVLWLRNTLLNWMIFLPALLALAMIPLFCRDALQALPAGWPAHLALAAGLTCLAVAVATACLRLPSHAPDDPGPSRLQLPAALLMTSPASNAPPTKAASARAPEERRQRDNAIIETFSVLPALGWAGFATLAAAPYLRAGAPPAHPATPFLVPAASLVAMLLGYLIAAARRPAHRAIFLRNAGWWLAASVVAAGLLWLGTYLGRGLSPETLTVLAPLWIIVAHLLQSTIYVGLRGDAKRGEIDREWLGRLSAVKVFPMAIWSVGAACCLYLPWLLIDHTSLATNWVSAAVTMASGSGAAFLGRSAASAFGPPGASDGKTAALGVSLNVVIAVATGVFAAGLFMLLARLGTIIVEHLLLPTPSGAVPTTTPFGARLAPYHWLATLALILVGCGLAGFFGTRISVNRFSLMSVYRNRLVRAFLGSARNGGRTPDSFTGFDAADNLRMADLADRPDGRANGRGLFHVINTTLNLTASVRPAWAERKGESFTITPLACGSANLRRRKDDTADGAYAATSKWGGSEPLSGDDDRANGITLGTAMAISGAAVSPNMGYHSSPTTAFLMTLFNVRLGAWLPNPATASAKVLKQSRPNNAVTTLAAELLGRTSDQGDAVYLSDGGHFENLGIYEMLRRRCRFILAIDSGEDPLARYHDLGELVRKARIDFATEISFVPQIAIPARSNPAPPGIDGLAVARITYPACDGASDTSGVLIYVRPVWTWEMPIDVRAYGATSPTFPHESTTQQFFTESQFESYRRLGLMEMDRHLGGVPIGVSPGGSGELASWFRRRAPMLPNAPVDCSG